MGTTCGSNLGLQNIKQITFRMVPKSHHQYLIAFVYISKPNFYTFIGTVKWQGKGGGGVVSIDRPLNPLHSTERTPALSTAKNLFERLNNNTCILTGSCGHRR